MVPERAQNVSQMEGSRLSAAPSIWNEEVATPKVNSGVKSFEDDGSVMVVINVVPMSQSISA